MISAAQFTPAWWLKNPHWQTIYPALFRTAAAGLHCSRERLTLPDTDFLDLDFYGQSDAPLLILLHGLAGSAQSGYISGLQLALSAAGLASVVINFRGCSGEPNRLARAYHAGDTDDLQFVYQSLRQRFPERPMAAIGFSLGGNVLLKWLGEGRSGIDLRAAIAVSVPLQLDVCATRLDSGWSKIYRAYLLGDLKRYMQDKRQYLQRQGLASEFDKLQQLGDLRNIRSFWQYDDRVVAPLHGFSGVDDYYRRSSARQYLKSIRLPTLIIQAVDDPFMTPAVLPSDDQLSASVVLELAAQGGHVGFIGGRKLLKPEYWLEQRILAFLSGYFPVR